MGFNERHFRPTGVEHVACQMINQPSFPLPSGALSYHLALAFIPSPNIYPQIDLRRPRVSLSSSSEVIVSQTCLDALTQDGKQQLCLLNVASVLLKEWKESIFGKREAKRFMCSGSDGRPVRTEWGMLMKDGNKRNLLKKITKTPSLNVRGRCQNQASAPKERPSDPPASVFQTTQWRRNLEVVFLARPWSPWRAEGQSPSATFGLASESLPWRAATALLGWFTVKSWPSWIVTPAPGSSSTPCTRGPGPASRSPPPTCSLSRRATAQRGRSHLKAPSRLFMPVTPARDSVCWYHRATARRSSLRSPGSRWGRAGGLLPLWPSRGRWWWTTWQRPAMRWWTSTPWLTGRSGRSGCSTDGLVQPGATATGSTGTRGFYTGWGGRCWTRGGSTRWAWPRAPGEAGKDSGERLHEPLPSPGTSWGHGGVLLAVHGSCERTQMESPR